MCGGESDLLAWTVCGRYTTDEVLWCKVEGERDREMWQMPHTSTHAQYGGTKPVRGGRSRVREPFYKGNEIFVLKQ